MTQRFMYQCTLKEKDTDKQKRMSGTDQVHKSHCCVMHGCKYNDDDCPVINGRIQQSFDCIDCDDDLLVKVVKFIDSINVSVEDLTTLAILQSVREHIVLLARAEHGVYNEEDSIDEE